MRKLAAIAALAAVGALIFSAVSSGDGGKYPLQRTAERKPVHAVEVPSGATAARAVPGLIVRYFETEPFPIAPNSRSDTRVTCPRRFRVVDGYFITDGGIVADTLSLGNTIRQYEFGLIDLTGQPGQAIIGIACLKGATS
jgi:hypothetical protein